MHTAERILTSLPLITQIQSFRNIMMKLRKYSSIYILRYITLEDKNSSFSSKDN